MKCFKNILVGIDLSQTDRLVSSELPPPSAEAVERALWLAKLNSARLTFFYALDISAAAQRMIEEEDGGEETVLGEARAVLKELVERAVAEGVIADAEVRFGKSWLELIRQVLQHEHDLVVAGTRHHGALHGVLMGSTGTKLLRKCPCPVWITQPQPEREIRSILVAHDLRPVGDLAMELGCTMAELHGAQLHVLHSLEISGMDEAFPARALPNNLVKLRADAEQYINRQLAGYEFAKPPQVHIEMEAKGLAILDHLDKDAIQLLVMGTIGRGGIAGFFVGSTAERLLPRIPCSILAVKPDDFICPIGIH